MPPTPLPWLPAFVASSLDHKTCRVFLFMGISKESKMEDSKFENLKSLESQHSKI